MRLGTFFMPEKGQPAGVAIVGPVLWQGHRHGRWPGL